MAGAFGYKNTINADNAYTVGSNSTVSADGAMVLGNNASVTAKNGMALGSNTKVANENAVALGAGSETAAAVATLSATINGTAHNLQGLIRLLQSAWVRRAVNGRSPMWRPAVFLPLLPMPSTAASCMR